jgi:hypothetical protein
MSGPHPATAGPQHPRSFTSRACRPPAWPQRVATRPWRGAAWRLALAAIGLGLSGCGGGLVISLGSYNDNPPDVSLTSNVGQARAGDVVQLSAAASDDYGVDTVEFIRIEPDGRQTRLGTDGRSPWSLDTVMPDVLASSATSAVRYLARATDGAGQRTDSATVTVQQLR